ncbi:MAG TPA: acetyltransferase [Thiopseudomonas sp.]|nr:acetyltransferase [Thiopseudomonas sp.]
MSKKLYGIYGASGLGKQVMPLAREQLGLTSQTTDYELVFIDDNPPQSEVNGNKVLTWEQFLRESASEKKVAISIANSKIREKISEKISREGVLPWSIQDSNVCVMDDVVVGVGSILSSFVLLASNIRVGNYFQANHYSHVAHDCVIGDYVTFGPGVRCNGNVHIEDHAYIGTGAMIRQGTPDNPIIIGKGAVVGMGAVVLNDVPAGVTVVGNPARPLEK